MPDDERLIAINGASHEVDRLGKYLIVIGLHPFNYNLPAAFDPLLSDPAET